MPRVFTLSVNYQAQCPTWLYMLIIQALFLRLNCRRSGAKLENKCRVAHSRRATGRNEFAEFSVKHMNSSFCSAAKVKVLLYYSCFLSVFQKLLLHLRIPPLYLFPGFSQLAANLRFSFTLPLFIPFPLFLFQQVVRDFLQLWVFLVVTSHNANKKEQP
jgi:hypothetical protein